LGGRNARFPQRKQEAGHPIVLNLFARAQAKGTLRGAITITDNASPPTQTVSLVGDAGGHERLIDHRDGRLGEKN
jgi:hypothetical protein